MYKLEKLLYIAPSYALFFGGMGGVIWQVMEYLKNGEWISVSIVTALQHFGLEWAHQPSQWIGLHKIFSLLPLHVCMMIVGALILFASEYLTKGENDGNT